MTRTASSKILAMDGLAVQVTRKRMRTMTLRISPEGEVRVSAPFSVPESEIRSFVASKRDWIDKARSHVLEERTAEEALWQDGSTICLWGEPLTIRYAGGADPVGWGAPVTRRGDELLLHGAAFDRSISLDGYDEAAREAIRQAERASACNVVSQWLCQQLEEALPGVVQRCEAEVGVHAAGWRLRHMKTRWGSCNTRTHVITLNTELAERPPQCLEGVVTHELCHLIEPSHNARFHALMDGHYPDWRRWRKVLNAQPPRREG